MLQILKFRIIENLNDEKRKPKPKQNQISLELKSILNECVLKIENTI